MIEGRTAETRQFLSLLPTLSAGSEQLNLLVVSVWLLLELEEYEAALRYSDEALALALSGIQRPQFLAFKAQALIALGRSAEARPLIDEALSLVPGDPDRFAYLLVEVGEEAQARALLDVGELTILNADNRALAYLALAEWDRCLDALALAVSNRDIEIYSLRTSNRWNTLRQNPRFAKILADWEASLVPTTDFVAAER
jgi:tetratricopeptide (TPR) repeat protein